MNGVYLYTIFRFKGENQGGKWGAGVGERGLGRGWGGAISTLNDRVIKIERRTTARPIW